MVFLGLGIRIAWFMFYYSSLNTLAEQNAYRESYELQIRTLNIFSEWDVVWQITKCAHVKNSYVVLLQPFSIIDKLKHSQGRCKMHRTRKTVVI